jgi:hypothetical protein
MRYSLLLLLALLVATLSQNVDVVEHDVPSSEIADRKLSEAETVETFRDDTLDRSLFEEYESSADVRKQSMQLFTLLSSENNILIVVLIFVAIEF